MIENEPPLIRNLNDIKIVNIFFNYFINEIIIIIIVK